MLVLEFVVAFVVVELAHEMAYGVVVVASWMVVVVMLVVVLVVAWAGPNRVAAGVVVQVIPVVVLGLAVVVVAPVVHVVHYEVIVVVLIEDDVVVAVGVAWAYDVAGSYPLMGVVPWALGLDDVVVVWSQLQAASVASSQAVGLENACVVADDDVGA